ncbi:amidohydrolase [Vibrio lamellibrachiae]|uniref:amidohydrolase n=1 Tax=Vibrio lamellibrachiae TaxID=2910253 RepID=UPI003D107AB7
MNKIYFNGPIITMDDAQPNVEALVESEGIIVATGALTTLKQEYSDAELVDLKGQTLLPGFIENHTHILFCANMVSMYDLSFFKYQNHEEMMSAFRSMEVNSDDGWIKAIGWDLKKQNVPTIELMDEVFPNTPLFVSMQGHGGWLNSAGFKKLGIDETTEAPENSEFVKDANGELTGLIIGVGAMITALGGTFPTPSKEEIIQVANDLSSHGFTTACDAFISTPMVLNEFVEASKSHDYGLRTLGSIPNVFPNYEQVIIDKENYKTDKFQIGFMKGFIDGSVQGGNAATDIEYLNEEFKGKPRPVFGTIEMFSDAMYRAFELNSDVMFHVNGNLALDASIEAAKLARAKATDNNLDHESLNILVHHLSLSSDEQYQSMNELGIKPSFIMGHHYWTGGQMINDYFAEDDLKYTFRMKSAIQHGLKPTLHNDAPVSPTAPWQNIKSAVTRETFTGEILNAPEAISVAQALKAYTSWAAEQLKMEDRVGTIEAGKLADFVIVDKNPLEIPVEQLNQIKVMTTIMNGNVTYQA